ncbi:DNA invertase Pin-like site-specific DNA recombinase [Alicyclobacillus tengchongensis]|uniref:DNA invertase Pin-like site-specific DNA recombinase n=1 Tax=Alicyclobacillus tolerans TaxID=90970 RepID=A0ABT9LX10_9BACL|nr:DNA invertase Pin-like site-specific DNA recombinase [Alicyclobacillus tengchongensis]
MTKVSKGFSKQFIKKNDLKPTEDVQAALRDLFASTMQGMLEAELDTHLGFTLSSTPKTRRRTTAATDIAVRPLPPNTAT